MPHVSVLMDDILRLTTNTRSFGSRIFQKGKSRVKLWDMNRTYTLLIFRAMGTRIDSGSGERTARLWDMGTGQNSLTFSIEDTVRSVAVSPDGKSLAERIMHPQRSNVHHILLLEVMMMSSISHRTELKLKRGLWRHFWNCSTLGASRLET